MTKQCGDCTLCCKLLIVSELEKPKGQWCRHVDMSKGCTIYSERPQSCRTFRCVWLMDPNLDEAWKPNRCNMILVAETDRHLVVQVDQGAVQPWRQEPYFSHLRSMSAKALAVGGMVTVMENGEATVILPDRGIALGKLEPGDRIVMGKVQTPDGPRVEATKVKADQMEAYRASRAAAAKPAP
jgi:hypothetical protein